MAKKKKGGRPRQAGSPPPTFDRIEMQAPLGWTEQVDAVAALVGLSRSAYIRLAVNERMVADRARLGLKPPGQEGGA
jgi:hypothetical protein